MSKRTSALIRALQLEPHPEGGYFREVFRSRVTVKPADSRAVRAAATSIYFLLLTGQRSLLHRVASDEVWHFYEGDPLQLTYFTSSLGQRTRVQLDSREPESLRVHVVPAGCWQAALPLGEYALVGCTVAPGFEFSDFTLLRDHPEEEAKLRERFPDIGEFV